MSNNQKESSTGSMSKTLYRRKGTGNEKDNEENLVIEQLKIETKDFPSH